MPMKSEDAISILTIHVQDETDTVNMFPSPRKLVAKLGQVTTQTLANNLSQLIKSLDQVVDAIPESCGDYDIHSLNFSLTFDTSGRVSLVGEIASGIKSGITITLRKKSGQTRE